MRTLAIGLLIVAGLWTWGFFSEFCLKSSLAELPKADKIVVHKAERTLMLYRASEVLKSYKVALGFNPIGHKEFEGDGKTPEGNYTIDSKNPKSRYFLNLGITTPTLSTLKMPKMLANRRAGILRFTDCLMAGAHLNVFLGFLIGQMAVSRWIMPR